MILIYLCPIRIPSPWQPHLIPNLINCPLGFRQTLLQHEEKKTFMPFKPTQKRYYFPMQICVNEQGIEVVQETVFLGLETVTKIDRMGFHDHQFNTNQQFNWYFRAGSIRTLTTPSHLQLFNLSVLNKIRNKLNKQIHLFILVFVERFAFRSLRLPVTVLI